MLFLMLRTYLLNAGRKEKNIESNIAFWRQVGLLRSKCAHLMEKAY